MEHIEQAGVHSGDSGCSLPPYYLKQATIDELKRQTAAMAKGLNVVGLSGAVMGFLAVDSVSRARSIRKPRRAWQCGRRPRGLTPIRPGPMLESSRTNVRRGG